MNKFVLIIITFLLSNLTIFCQIYSNTCCYFEDPYYQPVDMLIDIEELSAEISIEPYKQIVQGKSVYKFKTLRTNSDSAVFYTPEIKINSAKIDGKDIEFIVNGSNTTVYFNKLNYQGNYSLTLEFTANPTRELYFSGWNDPSGRKRKQIWSHSPNHWLPYINQKQDILKTELKVTFDSQYKVFSNGDRIAVNDNNDGTKTWHYKLNQPHVIYLMCLVIGDYDYIETKSGSGVPIELWYYPDQKDRVPVAYMYMEKMIDFFEMETGIKYPWGVYRQAPVVDYLFGGMETTTATVFGDYMFVDPRAWWMRNYVNVNAHELNHQWFGNLVSHLNNPHVWLTESFATYYAKLFERSIFGDDYYQWERDKELIRTMNAAKKDSRPVGHSQGGVDRWYPKGSLVLDMMRDVVGDEEFKTAIKYYVEKNYHQVTSTPDFLRALRESTGFSLDWFFDQWILRGGEPHFKISYNTSVVNGKKYVVLNIEQIHKVDELIKYFKMPVNIDIYFKDNTKMTYRNWVDGRQTDFMIEIPQDNEVEFLIFDPNRKIIKNLTFSRSFEELSSQATKAENMIDRYDALLALRQFSIEQKREVLKKSYYYEKFHLTKGEALNQLLNDQKSYDLIKDAINGNEELVKRIIVDSLKSVPSELEKDYRKLLKDSCYINVEKAFENLVYSFPENNYFDTIKDEMGWRGWNIRVKWLELSIMKSRNQKELLNELIDYTSPSFEFETRMNAFYSLKRLNILDNKILDNLIEAYNYWQFKLSAAALECMRYYYQQNEYKILIEKNVNINLLDKIKN